MNYTENYQLPQWVESDRVLMDDFNDMTEKIDTALGEHQEILTEHTAAIAGFGNCQIYYTTYTGKWYGGETQEYNRLTFPLPGRPFFVIVGCPTGGSSLWMTRGMVYAGGATVTWGENSISWIANSDSAQMNELNKPYILCAFLEK